MASIITSTSMKNDRRLNGKRFEPIEIDTSVEPHGELALMRAYLLNAREAVANAREAYPAVPDRITYCEARVERLKLAIHDYVAAHAD